MTTGKITKTEEYGKGFQCTIASHCNQVKVTTNTTINVTDPLLSPQKTLFPIRSAVRTVTKVCWVATGNSMDWYRRTIIYRHIHPIHKVPLLLSSPLPIAAKEAINLNSVDATTLNHGKHILPTQLIIAISAFSSTPRSLLSSRFAQHTSTTLQPSFLCPHFSPFIFAPTYCLPDTKAVSALKTIISPIKTDILNYRDTRIICWNELKHAPVRLKGQSVV